MTIVPINPKDTDEREVKLDFLAFQALNIDADKFPEITEHIKRFMVQDEEHKDYAQLAFELTDSDVDKCLPAPVVEFIVAAYQAEIEHDNAVAANNLGALYYGGRVGGEPDYEKAREYYELADRLGYPLASENLAYIYYYGRGTDVDYEKAYQLLCKAAFAGRHEAMYKLGDMYRYGHFVEQSDQMTAFCYHKALEWIQDDEMSAHKNGGCVCHRVGDLFFEGIWVDQDDEEALHFYQMAESNYYKQIAEGDKYHFDCLKAVVERQEELRKRIQEKLGKFEY